MDMPDREKTYESEDPTDDRLTSFLIAFDEAMNAGCLLEELKEFAETELPPVDRERFQEAQRCVELLNRLYRSPSSGSRSVPPNQTRTSHNSTKANLDRSKPFVGTARFEVLRQIGAGAMGIVYEVRDRERDIRIALKTLNQLDALGILRFKQEFRRLANVGHDNLVVLHELFQDGDDWFFTMELVDGVDFLTAIHGLKNGIVSTATIPGKVEMRLCWLFRQLAEGLIALHQAGILHRDLKPSNVLVTPDDRVVVIDFGLATNFHSWNTRTDQLREFAGTAAYMSPEQAAYQPAIPASDWYSFGVMLFQTFTGQLPFKGPLTLLSKQVHEPPMISESFPQVQRVWNELCRDLMARLPADRPTAQMVLERLGQIEHSFDSPRSTASHSLSNSSEVMDRASMPFVGRQAEMEELRNAYRYSCGGHPIVVSVQGTSGVGKTALVERFLEELDHDETTVVLRGRCHERDSVPHKTLDSLVDSISQYLNQLPQEDLASLLPADVPLLARMFPVLKCIPSIRQACAASDQPDFELVTDPTTLRRTAFDALRELLTRIATRVPLVLFIDDLHWGDSSGAIALANLIHAANPPKLMLVITFRKEHASDNACLKALGLGQLEPVTKEAHDSTRTLHSSYFKQTSIELAPLTSCESRELVASLLAQHSSMSQGRMGEVTLKTGSETENKIAVESGGLPYFVQELVRHLIATTQKASQIAPKLSIPDSQCLDLDEVLWQRVQQLPESSRRLIEIVAVAGHPIRLDLACEASVAKPIEGRLLNQLQTEHLLRSFGSGWRDNVTTFHDRISESVVARLSPETRRGLHGTLATALESSDETDAETLAYHFNAANNILRARHYYILAGEAAQKVFAFERAVELYRQALDLTPIGDTGAYPLMCKLGEACGQAGRGGDGAVAFLAAAEIAPQADALELRLAAARQYCISGHTDEGRRLLRDVLAANGIRLRHSPTAIMASLVSQRLRLWWRGRQHRVHSENTVNPELMRQIDLIWDAASGLSFQEPVVVASLHTRGLLKALEAGEPKRLVRALSWEAILSATAGTRAKSRVKELLDEAHRLASHVDDPVSRGMLSLGQGGAAFLQVRMRDATEELIKAEALFSSAAPKSWWELTTSRSLLAWAYMHIGDFQSLRHCVAAYARDAEERGDRFMLSSINSAGQPQLLLVDDRPDEAQRQIDELINDAPYEHFQQQHVSLLFSQAHIDLYRSDGQTAWQRFHDNWPRLRRSMQLHNQFARVTMLELRARCAVSAYRQERNKSMLFHARRDIARLKRERGEWVRPFIDRLMASIHEANGNVEAAIVSLEATAIGFDRLGFHICAATARRRLGQLVGGETGQQLSDSADQILLDESVQCAEKLQLVYCY